MPLSRAHLAVLALPLALPVAALPACNCGTEVIAEQLVELRLAPDAVDFGALPVGAAATRTVTLVNGGNAQYLPPDENAPFVDGDAFSLLTPCALPLGPDSFCDLEVRFAPRAEGPLAGGVVVIAPDGELLEVPLSGVGTPAQIVVEPAAIAFGGIAVGATASATFTVENRGDASVDVPLTVSGDGFFVDAGATPSLALDPGDVRTLPVTFSPSRGGAFSGEVVVEVCGPGCGPVVALTGEGLAPRIDVQPREAALGSVGVGESAAVELAVANVGAGDLVVQRLDLLTGIAADELAVDAPALPLTIAQGTQATVTVRYEPVSARAALASTLRIRSNDPVSPDVLIPVTGVTEGPALRLVPSVGAFGVLDPGASRDLDVVLRSTGTVPADVESVALTGAGFSFVTGAPPPGALAPGDSLLFAVRATAPAGSNGENGTLRVSAGAGLDDLVLPLSFFSGTEGCQPRAPLPNVALGSVVLGQGTSGTVSLQNIGTAPCVLEGAVQAPGLAFDPGFSFSAARAETLDVGGAPGAVELAFRAVDEGQRSAFVLLTFAGAPGPLLVSATARGVTGTLVGEPPVLEIGPLVEGCPTPARVATFVNRGGSDVNVTRVALEPAGTPFDATIPAVPMLILPGGAFTVPVQAQQPPPGVYEGEVRAFVDEDILEATVRVRLIVEPEGEPITETFEAAEVNQVDVLFVVDNSGSMEDDQLLLAQNFDQFTAAAFAGSDLSFHVGVTTTDVLGGTGGPLVDGFLTDSTGNLEERFADQALVGVFGNGIELGLEAMRRAVDDFAATTNAGFLRDDAALSVVIVSDEEDNGGDPGVAALDPSVVRPVETYVEVLEALKAGSINNAPVLVSVVVTPGFAQRYQTVANAFGGVVLDITSPDWGEQLSDVGEATLGLQRLFRLGSTPQPGSVTVTVDGVATTGFVVNGRTVTLTSDPPAGAVVDVTYEAGCE